MALSSTETAAADVAAEQERFETALTAVMEQTEALADKARTEMGEEEVVEENSEEAVPF